jgi:hypothetical protein
VRGHLELMSKPRLVAEVRAAEKRAQEAAEVARTLAAERDRAFAAAEAAKEFDEKRREERRRRDAARRARLRKIRAAREASEFAEELRQAFAATPPDPNAAEHLETLRQAIKETA